jgi:hypothetical protein
LSYRRSSAFIGGPIKNVLALGITPTKIYSPPMNADWKLSGSNWICTEPRPIQALSHRLFNPVQTGG